MRKPAEGSDFTNYEVFTIYCLLYADHCLHNDDIASVRNVQPFLIRSSASSHFSFLRECSNNLRELGILIILLLLMYLLSKVNVILFSQSYNSQLNLKPTIIITLCQLPQAVTIRKQMKLPVSQVTFLYEQWDLNNSFHPE